MSKLSVMVDFPVHGLDLTNHLASRSQPPQLNGGTQSKTLLKSITWHYRKLCVSLLFLQQAPRVAVLKQVESHPVGALSGHL